MNPVREGAKVGAIIGFVVGAMLTLVGGVILIGMAVSYDEWEAVLWASAATVLLVPLMGLFVATKGLIIGALWVMACRKLGRGTAGPPAQQVAGQP